jgi:hypothetical protein
MKRRRPRRAALAGAQKVLPKTPYTGEHCPNSGWWAPASNPTKGYFIGEATSWVPLVNPAGMRRAYDDPGPWHPGNII